MRWLSPYNLNFPPSQSVTPEGIIALGGDLSPERLLVAYNRGIFPWYNPGDPIVWWLPDPRFVVFPEELHISKSLRPYFNQQRYRVTFDTAFEQVIDVCRSIPRNGQVGSWLTLDMVEAYIQMHRLGYGHSVEVWQEEQLVGGLYGLSIGKVFYGESMFSKASNASKVGFVELTLRLQQLEYWLIDCQQPSKHLHSMGGRGISREEFNRIMARNTLETTRTGSWTQLLGEMTVTYPW